MARTLRRYRTRGTVPAVHCVWLLVFAGCGDDAHPGSAGTPRVDRDATIARDGATPKTRPPNDGLDASAGTPVSVGGGAGFAGRDGASGRDGTPMSGSGGRSGSSVDAADQPGMSVADARVPLPDAAPPGPETDGGGIDADAGPANECSAGRRRRDPRNLVNASLGGADLRNVNWIGKDATGALLADAQMDNAAAYDLLGCPYTMPSTSWKCVAQPANGRYAMVGRNEDLRGANLAWVELLTTEYANGGTAQTGGVLQGSDLRCADMLGADLTYTISDDLVGCPARLPGTGWSCVPEHETDRYALLGPKAVVFASLVGADLTGVDLTGTFVLGKTYDLLGCPAKLPEAFTCVLQPANGRYALVGFDSVTGADLSGANLAHAFLGGDLTGTKLAGADLTGIAVGGLLKCPASLPDGWRCVTEPSREQPPPPEGGPFALVGPGADLSAALLSGADLSGADLTGATKVRAYDLVGCPATLPGPGWKCVAEAGGARFALVGPRAVVEQADLTDADLSQVDLTGAVLSGLSGCPSKLPSTRFKCIRVPATFVQTLSNWAVLGPGMRFSDLGGADLTGVDLTGGAPYANAAFTYNLVACPSSLPSADWRCVKQPANGRFALLGPGVGLDDADLSAADLSHANLSGTFLDTTNFSGANLRQTNLSGAALPHAILKGADLTGADMTGAGLGDAVTSNLAGCPASLPSVEWKCVAAPGGSILLGPGVNLAGVNLTGLDLSGAGTARVSACPASLPPRYACVSTQFGPQYSRLVGPRLNLSNSDLRGLELAGTSLVGTDLTNTLTYDLGSCPMEDPGPTWRCSMGILVGPGVSLAGAKLNGLDLSGVDLTGTVLDGTSAFDLTGCPAKLPAAGWKCIAQPDAAGHFSLIGPHLEYAGANLGHANLAGANLSFTFFKNTNLAAAVFTGARLDGVAWVHTTCPDGVDSATAGNTCEGHL